MIMPLVLRFDVIKCKWNDDLQKVLYKEITYSTYIWTWMNIQQHQTYVPETSLKEKLDYIHIGKVDRKFKKTLFKKDIFQGQSYFIWI